MFFFWALDSNPHLLVTLSWYLPPLQDFNLSGTRILSGGMDHALKLWEADTPKLQQIIRDSSEYQRSSKKYGIFLRPCLAGFCLL